jgi:hypothetical protein
MTSIDDFEWGEEGFDVHYLIHKRFDFKVASVRNFNGWYVTVWKERSPRGDSALVTNVEDLEAAKAIAVLYASKHMEKYDEYIRTKSPPYPKRTSVFRPGSFPKGVFKVV